MREESCKTVKIFGLIPTRYKHLATRFQRMESHFKNISGCCSLQIWTRGAITATRLLLCKCMIAVVEEKMSTYPLLSYSWQFLMILALLLQSTKPKTFNKITVQKVFNIPIRLLQTYLPVTRAPKSRTVWEQQQTVQWQRQRQLLPCHPIPLLSCIRYRPCKRPFKKKLNTNE